jgi:hypothetical protein
MPLLSVCASAPISIPGVRSHTGGKLSSDDEEGWHQLLSALVFNTPECPPHLPHDSTDGPLLGVGVTAPMCIPGKYRNTQPNVLSDDENDWHHLFGSLVSNTPECSSAESSLSFDGIVFGCPVSGHQSHVRRLDFSLCTVARVDHQQNPPVHALPSFSLDSHDSDSDSCGPCIPASWSEDDDEIRILE